MICNHLRGAKRSLCARMGFVVSQVRESGPGAPGTDVERGIAMIRKLVRAVIFLCLSMTLVALLLMPRAANGQSKGFFTEPQSTLLFSGLYGTSFLVVTPTGDFTVPSPPGSIMEVSGPLPALAPAGDQVASSVRLPIDSNNAKCSPFPYKLCPGLRPEYKSVMGVYSTRDKTWKLYGNFCFAGSAAFSPDGKKVAFEVTTRSDNPNCNSLPGSQMLMILDLETGQFTPVPVSVPGNGQLELGA